MSQLLNIGSISKIEIALASEVFTSLPNSANIVTIDSPPTWVEIDKTFESASLAHSHSFVNEGSKYSIAASWIKPKISNTNNVSAMAYLNKPVSLKFTDANGTIYIVGNSNNPAYIKLDINIPKDAAGLNHYLFNVIYPSAYALELLG